MKVVCFYTVRKCVNGGDVDVAVMAYLVGAGRHFNKGVGEANELRVGIQIISGSHGNEFNSLLITC